jgi:flagellar M-ring protein FliF
VLTTREKLSRGQVSAIQHLVAAAVSGLQPNAVAIVDNMGELLSPGQGDSGDAAVAASQEERSTAYENRLRESVENIVASVVGPGHVQVQVSADMDFNRVTENSETFDPDGKVLRSSQTTEESSNERSNGTTGQAVSVGSALPGSQAPQSAESQQSSGNSNTRTQETLNYEISRRTRTQVNEAGSVKRLSVAVVVDGKWSAPDANGHRSYTPRSGAEMAQITALVRSAVGYTQARGDQLQVTNMRFAEVDVPPEAPVSEPLLGIDNEVWLKWGEVFLLCVTALLVFFFIVRPMIRRLTAPIGIPGQPALAVAGAAPALTADGQAQAAPAPAQIAAQPTPPALPPSRRESMIDISQIEGQVRESAIRKVGEVVTAHPEEAMAILRTWLHEPA